MIARLPTATVLAAALLGTPACSEGEGKAALREEIAAERRARTQPERPNFAAAPPREVLKTPARELLRAEDAAQRLSGESRFVWQAGDRSAELVEALLLETDGLGGLHARLEASNDDGFELLEVGDKRWIRRRYAPYHLYADIGSHAPLGGDEVWRSLVRFEEVFGDAIDFKPKGELELEGRKARRFEIVLSGRPLPPVPEAAPPRSWSDLKPPPPEAAPLAPGHWRRGLQPVEAAGHVVLDARSGLPLDLELNGRLVDNSGETPIVLLVEARGRWQILANADAPKLEAPADAMPPPQRPREPLDRLAFWKKLSGSKPQRPASPAASPSTGAAAEGARPKPQAPKPPPATEPQPE